MGFVIDPKKYRTWVAFAHDFCRGCRYENGFEKYRIDECFKCKSVLDAYYYRERKPIRVTRDENGKNVVSIKKKIENNQSFSFKK